MPYDQGVDSSGIPPPLDLSHAAKLKSVELRFESLSVQWIVAMLQTAKTICFRRVTIFIGVCFDVVEEVDRREWRDLDHLLVRLWTSHSIVPKLSYVVTKEIRSLVPTLLPALVNSGLVD